MISEPDDHTVIDARGGVRSIQAANVTMPEGQLAEMWTPDAPRAPRPHLLEATSRA